MAWPYNEPRTALPVIDCNMRRLHLFEFGDQQWLPQVLRDAETAYLATAYRLWPGLTRQWAERVATVLHRGEPAEIFDLCSGSGGAISLIVEELLKQDYDVRARLSDLYPSPNSGSHPRVSWLAGPVDARRVPPRLSGVRTMFSAFHHFRPDAAQAILRDAFEHRRAICIFESGSGTLRGIAAMCGVPLVVLCLMPFVRPFRWAYMAFTYLIPLIPFIVLWDGIVSMLRIYSSRQLWKLTATLQAPDYVWEIGEIKVRGIPDRLPFLIGRPTSYTLPVVRLPLTKRGEGTLHPE
jgi:hypothetical protein